MKNKRIKPLKNCGCAVALLVAGITIGLVLLGAVYIMSTWRIQYHIGESIMIMKDEGDYPVTKTGEILDNFTDAIMLNMICYKDGDFADNMLLSQYVSGENPTPVDNLYDYLMYGMNSTQRIVSYARYWHGYQAILTPLLVLFNVNEIRAINMLTQLTLIVGIVTVLSRRERADMVVPFAVMYFCLAPIALFYSFQFSSTFYVMCFLSLIIASKYGEWSFVKLCFAFETAGIMEAYFDFLTYPAVSLGVPLIMYFALDTEVRKTLVQRVKELLLLGAAWAFGYSGMWSGKWVLATLFTDENVISNAIYAIKIRSSAGTEERSLSYTETVFRNIHFLLEANCGLLWLIICVAVLIWLVLMFSKRKHALQWSWTVVVIIGVCCFIPFVWYLFTINHSNIHSWFTFRELAITVYGIMTLLYLALYRKPKQMPDAG